MSNEKCLQLSDTKLLVTMPLLYRPNRLIYFFDQIRCLWDCKCGFIDVRIVTNTFDIEAKASILALLRPFQSEKFQISINSFWDEADPKRMTWVHKSLIADEFLSSTEYTHFIYLEDDLRFCGRNLEYFIQMRPILDPLGFIPSFVRYEFNFDKHQLFTSDIIRSSPLSEQSICVRDRYFVMANNPYCAAYILDKELAAEYVNTTSFDHDRSTAVCRWPSTERSAMGLCFENVPPGHLSRFKILVDLDRGIPAAECLIHHLPNNFTNRTWPEGHTPFGKTPLLDVFKI